MIDRNVPVKHILSVIPKGEKIMKLTPPKTLTFWIAVLLGILGFIGKLVTIPVVSPFAFWLVFLAFVLLVLGLLVKGL
jgi:hypothetical protein